MNSAESESRFEIYGHPVREYKGAGVITLSTGQCYDCSFSAAQICDGFIVFRVNVPGQDAGPSPLFNAFWNDTQPMRIEGNTADGLHVLADENLLLLSSPDWTKASEYVVKSGRLSVKASADEKRPARLLFGFVNLDFLGNEVVASGGGVSLSRLRLHLSSSEVVFDQRPGYKEVLATIKGRRGADLTSTAEVPLSGTTNIESAVALADDLALLFSLARARFVNYIYYDVLDSDGQILETEHRSKILRSWPARSFPPVDYRQAEATEKFVQAAFPVLQELKVELGEDEEGQERVVRKLVHAFLDAHTAGFYLTGALTCVSLLDFLRGRWAEKRGELYLVPGEEFRRRHAGNLTKKIQPVLKEEFPDVEQPKIELMAKHLHGFYWWPYRDSYQRFFASDWVGVFVDKSELGRFLEIRNDLVHRMKFPSTDREGQWNEYLFLVDLLNRVFLALLRYEGPYINWRTKKTEPFKRLSHTL